MSDTAMYLTGGALWALIAGLLVIVNRANGRKR